MKKLKFRFPVATKILLSVFVFGISLIVTGFFYKEVFTFQSMESKSDAVKIAPTKQPDAYPTFASNFDDYKQGSVKSATTVNTSVSEINQDPLVECTISKNCGGGSITVRRSECASQKCCEYSPGKWKNMSISECYDTQVVTYGQLYAPQILTPTLIPIPDQTKIAAIKNAVGQAAVHKTKADFAWEQMLEYKKEQLDCGERTRKSALESAERGVPLSPSSQLSIQQSCESGYQPLINEFRLINQTEFNQYNEWYRQANQLLSECPSCASFINTK